MHVISLIESNHCENTNVIQKIKQSHFFHTLLLQVIIQRSTEK